MYKGKEGIYEITMPMEGEGVVVGGRETYGEPKKIADVTATKDGDDCSATVTRHGITYLELKGKATESLETSSFTDEVYCFKVFPSCEQHKPVDQNPLLVKINMHRTQSVHMKQLHHQMHQSWKRLMSCHMYHLCIQDTILRRIKHERF